MKKIIIAFFIVCPLIASCVQSMDESQAPAIAGKIWAVVDTDDMASRYLVFEHGYLYEYESVNKYFVHDGILWGAVGSPKGCNKYEYSLLNGSIHYHNYYKNVRTSLTVDDNNVMMLGKERCLQITDTNESMYSKIILSEANKKEFLCDGEDVEWSFEIENPVDGFELEVAEAPKWCGSAEGVKVENGKIHFSVQPVVETHNDRFVFTYPSAPDIEVQVNLNAPVIVLSERNKTFEHHPGTHSFTYEIKNQIKGARLEFNCTEDWITDLTDNDGTITFSIDANSTFQPRYAYIHFDYCGVKALYSITQTFADTYIRLDPYEDTVTYEDGVYSFNYRIENPLHGVELQAKSDVDWIHDIKIGDGVITYTVKRNNSGAVRTGSITLKYYLLQYVFTLKQDTVH